MNESLDQIYCKAPLPKSEATQRGQRLKQVLIELDGRTQAGTLDWAQMETRYPQLPSAIKLLRRLEIVLYIIMFLGLVGIAILCLFGKVHIYEALALGVALAVGVTIQRALCVLMSEGASLAVDCERSLRVQREALLHVAKMMEQQIEAAQK